MNEIIPYLYLGDCFDAQNLKELQRAGITHILIVASELNPIYPKQFTYLKIDASDIDTFNMFDHFDSIADFIQNAIKQKGVVFVHCAVGVSRSPSAIISYLIKYKKLGFRKALQYVEEKRPIISPNEGFLKQLQLYAQAQKTSENKKMKQDKFSQTVQEEKKQNENQLFQKQKIKLKKYQQEYKLIKETSKFQKN